MIYLGFTGRAAGLSTGQRRTIRELLDAHLRDLCVALHNDGEGADQEFASIAKELGFRVETTSANLRPMPRNRELVAKSLKIFACPPTDYLLSTGSGSWETVKYGWKARKTTVVVLDDGSLIFERAKLPLKP